MTVSTTQIAAQYTGIAAGVPIAVNMPVYDTTEYEVLYGATALLAVLGMDYSITPALDFNSFTLTPTASLITKIGVGTNVIVVRQKLSQLTSATSAAVRDTIFTAFEFNRVWRGIQEIADGLRRSIGFSDGVIVDAPKMAAPIAASQMLATDATGTKIVSGGNVTDFLAATAAAATAVAQAAIATAQAAAAAVQAGIATAQAVIATTMAGNASTSATNAANSANAAIVAKMVWRGNWTTGVAYALNDVVRSAPGLGSYICIAANTASASFAADLAASKWQLQAADGANGAGTGDMLKATYDPTNKNSNAFAMDNMVEGATTKIMTGAERTKLAGIDTGAQVTSAANVAAAISAGGIKTTPVDADVWAILDSAASFALKYVSGSAIKLYVLASAALTGTPTAPTAASGTSTTQIATTAFVEGMDSPNVITYSAGVAVNHALSLTQSCVLGGSGVIANPTNPRVGKTLDLILTQDATGARVPTWGANYDFGDYGTPVLSSGANQADLLSFKCISTTKYAFLGIRKRVD